MDRHRDTGRTTRMIKYALYLAGRGRAVYVIAANDREARRIASLLPDAPHGIKVEAAESLGNFDWSTLTLRGAHPNCAVLVDHYAIESRFGPVLRELHAYDGVEG